MNVDVDVHWPIVKCLNQDGYKSVENSQLRNILSFHMLPMSNSES